MSTLLSAQSIHYHTTSTPLFEAVSFTLKKGDRIGLVGHNGCGKSTLLHLLFGSLEPQSGEVTLASHCLMERVEQHLPNSLEPLTMLQAVLDKLPEDQRLTEQWRAECVLSDMGFTLDDWSLSAGSLSGGQHTRLLLARALISQPDLLLLDEPSNHLDLPTLLWLERFLLTWKGSFVLVSHDKRLLDKVTNCTWVVRNHTLCSFGMPCSEALQALEQMNDDELKRHLVEQKEIDRVEKSAKRLATWGRVYDNEDLSRKAKNMEKRLERLKDAQTELVAATPWKLRLHGEAMKANRLLQLSSLSVTPAPEAPSLFQVIAQQIKSGERVAIIGSNGCGKSSLLRMLWHSVRQPSAPGYAIQCHPRARVGFYDQSLKQLSDDETLIDALAVFSDLSQEQRKMALISAGFAFVRHSQRVRELSGGERSRLLMVGLSLANYHLLLLDEPTNHLDLDGKAELAEALNQFAGGVLLVTHDRELIEQSCNRFWLVNHGELSEWHDIEQLYAELDFEASGSEQAALHASGEPAPVTATQPVRNSPEELLLQRLVELEAALEAELRRKPKHQKPKLQQQWRTEIEQLYLKLELV
ncbi:ABC-F family ATP-binding cassette domain-containing protein [Aliagarivorans marinus]|uniref:ABC-F family ATP-binding cassette domain-containing protein n=1 Tax=Aliagarivorans marinus TaxID=561965 RepID=UPI00040BB8D1|nr:ABC-F family ATP-binding cassette domain-containing protein [Aliagarivorans marinus]